VEFSNRVRGHNKKAAMDGFSANQQPIRGSVHLKCSLFDMMIVEQFLTAVSRGSPAEILPRVSVFLFCFDTNNSIVFFTRGDMMIPCQA